MPGETVMMSPSFQQNVRPDLPAGLRYPHHAVATALLVALCVVLVAGAPFLPRWLRFTRYTPWMRATLVVWYGPPLTSLLAEGRP